MTRRMIAAALLFVNLAVFSAAQEKVEPEPYKPEEFPAWSRSLRRGEIIALGLFPFVYFFSTMAYESGRFFASGMDARYAPGPFGGADAASMSRDEKNRVILISISLSMILAAIDYFIEGKK